MGGDTPQEVQLPMLQMRALSPRRVSAAMSLPQLPLSTARTASALPDALDCSRRSVHRLVSGAFTARPGSRPPPMAAALRPLDGSLADEAISPWASQSARPAAPIGDALSEFLSGDPWEGCQDIARDDLLAWCQDFVKLTGRCLGEDGAELLQDASACASELPQDGRPARRCEQTAELEGGCSGRYSIASASTAASQRSFASLRLATSSSLSSCSSLPLAAADAERGPGALGGDGQLPRERRQDLASGREPASLPDMALSRQGSGAVSDASDAEGHLSEERPLEGSLSPWHRGVCVSFAFRSALRPSAGDWSSSRERGSRSSLFFGGALQPCGDWMTAGGKLEAQTAC